MPITFSVRQHTITIEDQGLRKVLGLSFSGRFNRCRGGFSRCSERARPWSDAMGWDSEGIDLHSFPERYQKSGQYNAKLLVLKHR